MKQINILLLFLAISVVPVSAENAVAEPPVDELQKLLEQTIRWAEENAEINQRREQRFKAQKTRQSQLLKEAKAEQQQVQTKADTLKALYDQNAAELQQLEENLQQQTGDLQEVFGVARAAAADLQILLDDSMVASQRPGQDLILKAMADSQTLPSIELLEGMWLIAQQEMTEVGQVVHFKAPVTRTDGSTAVSEITRIGGFSAISEGQYLAHEPSGFVELLRQPDTSAGGVNRLMSMIGLAETDDALRPVLLDPSRGELLQLAAARPTWQERFHHGGVVGYIIVGLAALGLLLALWRWLALGVAGLGIRRQAKRLGTIKTSNALGRVLAVGAQADVSSEGNNNVNLETLELQLDEAILKETPRLERGLSMLKLLAAVAPLLGLLGTVTGMIVTFGTITEHGTGDPRLMADGIQQALMTTVFGLVAAIPLLFLHNWLNTKARALIQIIDQQSAGLLARQVEAMHVVASSTAAETSNE